MQTLPESRLAAMWPPALTPERGESSPLPLWAETRRKVAVCNPSSISTWLLTLGEVVQPHSAQVLYEGQESSGARAGWGPVGRSSVEARFVGELLSGTIFSMTFR